MQSANNTWMDELIKAPAPPTWNEARLQEYISNGVEESLTLDYKGPDALGKNKADDITKAVSSFANSVGGVVIYGICESSSPEDRHLPDRIEPVDRRQFSREWLEQIIGRIQPRLSVVIHPVQLYSGLDHVAYVVEIPQGSVAHQATDLRYYKRHNFQAVPMQDYEIRDTNRRKSHPSVITAIRISVGRTGQVNSLIWHVKNESDIMARWVSSVVDVPTQILGRDIRFNFQGPDLRLDDEGFASWRLEPSNVAGKPLFPRAELMVDFRFSFSLVLDQEGEPTKSRNVVRFKTFADEMPMREGGFELDKIIHHSPFD